MTTIALFRDQQYLPVTEPQLQQQPALLPQATPVPPVQQHQAQALQQHQHLQALVLVLMLTHALLQDTSVPVPIVLFTIIVPRLTAYTSVFSLAAVLDCTMILV